MQAGPDMGRYYADVPNRLVGYLIDVSFLTVLSFVGAVIISVIFGPVVKIDLSSDPHVTIDQGLAVLNAIVSTAISAAYFIGTWRRFRGSPGQRLLRMEMGTEDGASLTYGNGAIRWLMIGLPLCLEASLTPFVSGSVDALLILSVLVWDLCLLISTARNPMKRGWHDRLAGTFVTKLALAVASADTSDPEAAVVR
jgi:uncharacterized RDD family membrane protein YckC